MQWLLYVSDITNYLQFKIAFKMEHFLVLEEYLKANRMQATLTALRQELFKQLPSQQPSQQLLQMIVEHSNSKSVKQQQLPNKRQNNSGLINNVPSLLERQSSKTSKNKSARKREDMIAEGLLGKIAYSNKLLQDKSVNAKVDSMLNNKIFLKVASKLFPNSAHLSNRDQPSYSENSYEQPQNGYQDELEFASVDPRHKNNNYYQPGEMELQITEKQKDQESYIQNRQNHISLIDMNNDQSSILSQPSFVLQQLNREPQIEDDYSDDNDLGYHLISFQDYELQKGCAQLTQKFNYPQCAVIKNSKKAPNSNSNALSSRNTKDGRSNKKKKNNKFPQGIYFPKFGDSSYPIEYDGTVFDCMKIQVVYDRDRTGYEQTDELQFVEGDIVAGKFQVSGVMGSGVFAKVYKATNLQTGMETCLKMISNNKDPSTNQPTKDFFDQALDEIKLLNYINANCNPDEHFLLSMRSYFYHREHLFIETDLLKDNLYFAYKKNPHFFSIPTIRQIARQILEALSALHSLHVMHADLKPQNILIKSYDPVQVKVIDLGNSCFFHDHLGSYVQSRSYRAPEVVLGVQYNEKIDLWSLGCILAELWTKNVLFYNTCVPGMLARVQGIVGPWPEWMLETGKAAPHYFSKENLIFYEEPPRINIMIPKKTSLENRVRCDDQMFLSFLSDLLKIDPHIRMSAQDALKHPFLL